MSNLFSEINLTEISGVAFKSIAMKKNILNYLITNGDSTISDMCKELNASVPTITKLINELEEENYILDYGKIETVGGRRPNIYGLNPASGYFMGVEVKWVSVNLVMMDFSKNITKISENIPFALENSKGSLDTLCAIILKFIKSSGIPIVKILGMGVNLSGRVNSNTGYSYSFFHFEEEPLTKIFESKIGIKTYVENDTRAMTNGEYQCGVVKGEQNVLFINLSMGIGLGIVSNGKLFYGKSGFTGEFGHIPFSNNEILCQCGKKGCLETEVSGRALLRRFNERIAEGSNSLLAAKIKGGGSIKLEDIIEAVKQEDMLAIELISELGEKLGKGIAILINIFNPELVIIGGTLAGTGDYLTLPVKSSVNKYALNMVYSDTVIKLSKLKGRAGVIGASLLVQSKLLQ